VEIKIILLFFLFQTAFLCIKYTIPNSREKYKRILVWFAAFSNHCSLFPGSTMIELFKEDLKNFSTTKGTIHFPMDKPVPATLIKKIVKAKVVENEKKSKR
jgi:uncharacterized protein YdhG (YjbR/CyaY superfamily)